MVKRKQKSRARPVDAPIAPVIPGIPSSDLKEPTHGISIKPLEGDYRRWMSIIGKLRERHPECTMRGLFRNAIVILEDHFRAGSA